MMAQTVSSGCVTRRAVLGANSSKMKVGCGEVIVVVGAGWMTSLRRRAEVAVMNSPRLTCRGGSADE